MNSPVLKIYLHDNSDCFRIQLVGRLESNDLGEVASCWKTSRSSVAGHPLVVDLTRLETVDEAGRQWLAEMKLEGVQFRDGNGFSGDVPLRLTEQSAKAAPPQPNGGTCRWLRSWFGASPKNAFDQLH